MTATVQPTIQALLDAARMMAPTLRSRLADAEAARQVPAETIDDFRRAGFFRMLQPRRFGGYAMSPRDFYAVVFEVARHCPSSGWVLSVAGVHNWQLGLLAETAQDDVWAEDPDVLVSSSYMPCGNVQPVAGGYRLSGRWQFSSGCDHCDWAFLGAMVPADDATEPPSLYTFLVPRRDYLIDDDWFASGLRASGSKAIIVDDAFVPFHRLHSFLDGFRCQNPGQAVNPEPVYRLPFGQVFIRAVSFPAVGAAQGALDHYLDYNRGRINSAGAQATALPATLSAAAQAAGVIRSARLKLADAFDTMMALAEAGEEIPIPLRAQYRYDSSAAVEECLLAVQRLLGNSGGRAIYADNDINRYLQDLIAFRQHAMNEPDKPARSLGGILIGLENEEFFI